jgi:hypothetical protein
MITARFMAAADRAERAAVVLNVPEGYLGVIDVLGEGPAWSDLLAEVDGLRHRAGTRVGRCGSGSVVWESVCRVAAGLGGGVGLSSDAGC